LIAAGLRINETSWWTSNKEVIDKRLTSCHGRRESSWLDRDMGARRETLLAIGVGAWIRVIWHRIGVVR
jgi:hypothetical protein